MSKKNDARVRNVTELNSTLKSLLTSIWAIDKSQEPILESLLSEALNEIGMGNSKIRQELFTLLEVRQLKLAGIHHQLASEYARNFTMMKQVLMATAKKPALPIFGADAPRPVTARQQKLLDNKIQTLALPTRAHNCLIGETIYTIRDLLERSAIDLMKIPNLGMSSFRAIESALALRDFLVGHLYDPNKPAPVIKWEGEA